MQLFDNNDTVSTIYQQAISLSISKDFAEQCRGKISLVDFQGSEQENSRREFLSVELQAQQEKIVTEHGQERFRQQVMTTFFAQVKKQVNETFDNKAYLYNSVLNIEEEVPLILELLSLRTTSINKIKTLTTSLPWLATDLITLINKPQYRKRADIQVNDIKLALSYIGLDNLKLMVPTFIVKHWLPTNTVPFNLMKRKLWNDSVSIALASSTLAKASGANCYTAFTTALLSNLGHLAITRCFLATYDRIYQQELRKAYDKKDKPLHDILVNVENPPELLREQLILRSSKLSAKLIEFMNFDRLPITEAMFDLAYADTIDKMNPIAQLITKAKVYVYYRNLAKSKLITTEEALVFFESAKLNKAEITLLKKSDIDHIKLKFN